MGKKNLTKALMALNNRGLCEASREPKLIDIQKIKVGDKVIFWNDSGLKDDENLEKGMVYTVSYADTKFEMITLIGFTRMYLSENYEYEIGWEYWRFCLPEDYNESGIYINRLRNEPIQATEFAGRIIYSKYVMDIEQFGIPWKSLRRDLFAEIEHPQYEILFQFEVDGTSRFYLSKFQGYWLLLHRIRSETDWLIGDNIHNYSLAMIMPVVENDSKQIAAQIMLSLWFLHYADIHSAEDDYRMENLIQRHKVLRGGSNSVLYLSKVKITRLLELLEGKSFRQASENVRLELAG